jgi:MFS family permease
VTSFRRRRWPGGIGLLSAILGVGGGAGIVLSGVIVEHLDYHWLFWIPLVAIVAAGILTWRLVPESPVRVPGKVNWLASTLMTIGISAVLLAISQTTEWGWASTKTAGLILVGFAFIAVWIAVEVRSENPLVDMAMMRIRGVWTTNAAAFLLGAGLYASFIVFPQFAQLPTSTGFGFGASVVVSGLYLLPSTIGMTVLGVKAGAISARFGSRAALLGGTVSRSPPSCCWRSPTARPGSSCSRRPCSGSGSASPSPPSATSSSRPCPATRPASPVGSTRLCGPWAEPSAVSCRRPSSPNTPPAACRP